MVWDKVTQIRDLKIVLKDMEPYIRNPQFLRVGRRFTNFNMLPREALANWLICTVERFEGEDWTFSDDPNGSDGRIVDLKTSTGFTTEHVFIPPPKAESTESVSDLMVEAVKKKAKKGKQYAEGKVLVIFSEGQGEFKPNIVARRTLELHHFDAIYMVGLEKIDESGYHYWVTHLHPLISPIWKIDITSNFDDWSVKRVQ